MKTTLILTIGIILYGCGGGSGGNGGGSTVPSAGGPGPSIANAQTLDTTSVAVISDIDFTLFTLSGLTGVQSVSCPSNRVAVSSGCVCHVPDAGPIFGNQNAGNGAVCGCMVGNGGPSNSPIDVYVMCASATFANALSSATIKKPESQTLSKEEQKAIWDKEIKAKEDEFRAMRTAME